MEDFDKFLKANGLTLADVARYLGVSPQYVGQVKKGTSKLSMDSIAKIKSNDLWNTSMFPDPYAPSQSVLNNAPIKSQVNFPYSDSDLWKKLCEEKDKRIAELERTIQILLNK